MSTIQPTILDFANHHPDATEADIKKLCEGVIQYGFNSAFVNPNHIAYARSILGTKAKVGTVISFPLGDDIRDIKIHAIREAINAGADELDIVPTISFLIEGKSDILLEELSILTSESKHMCADVIVKFIIETGLFIDEKGNEFKPGYKELVRSAALMIEKSGADFVKLCTGMGPRGVSPADVTLVRSAVGPNMKIKGAGGIDTLEEASALIAAGANRLGTSHAIQIIQRNADSTTPATIPPITPPETPALKTTE